MHPPAPRFACKTCTGNSSATNTMASIPHIECSEEEKMRARENCRPQILLDFVESTRTGRKHCNPGTVAQIYFNSSIVVLPQQWCTHIHACRVCTFTAFLSTSHSFQTSPHLHLVSQCLCIVDNLRPGRCPFFGKGFAKIRRWVVHRWHLFAFSCGRRRTQCGAAFSSVVQTIGR